MLAASPGERLRTLRELLGLTQKQLADVAGIAQSWVSQVETGTRDATDDGLEAIAQATGTPLKFFYVTPPAIPLDSLQFRKRAAASSKVTRRVRAFFGESYRVTDNVLKVEKYPPPPLPYATAETLSQPEIEELAEETRRALGLAPDKPIPHLTRALERAGVAVAPIALTGLNGEETTTTNHHFGVSYWGGRGEPALIGYFPGQQGDRDRFTLAHEVGHLVLHTFRPWAKDPEREANRFAGALMVPRIRSGEITERLSLTDYARMKAVWGVSIQALIMRGAAAGNIGDIRVRSLFVQLNQRDWRKKEPVEVGKEDPILLWRVLSRRFGARPYIAAAEDLAIFPALLRSIAPTPESQHQRLAPRVDNPVVQLRRVR